MDFHEFVVKAMPWALSIPMGQIVKGDWRNVCVNEALTHSNSEWVLFMEQDFLPLDLDFWNQVLTSVEDFDVAGFSDVSRKEFVPGKGAWQHGVRLHPAFLLVRRSIIEQTGKDFGAHPEPSVDRDHFGVVSDEMRAIQGVRFFDVAVLGGSWRHWAGLSSNYMLAMEGNKPNYYPEEFFDYVYQAMNAPVVQDNRFIELSKKILEL